MVLRRLSVECKDGDGNPSSMWIDEDIPDDVIVVDRLLDPSPVPLGLGEAAILLSRQLVRDAEITS